MVIENLTQTKIKNLIGVNGDWNQWNTYVSLADNLRNDSIREDLGLPTSDTGIPVIGEPTLVTCDCGERYPLELTNCPTCGLQPGEERISPEQVGSMYQDADDDAVLSVLENLKKSIES